MKVNEADWFAPLWGVDALCDFLRAVDSQNQQKTADQFTELAFADQAVVYVSLENVRYPVFRIVIVTLLYHSKLLH